MILAMSYARALLEGAKESGAKEAELTTIETQLSELTQVLRSSKQLWAALTGPATSAQEKGALITAICAKTGITGILERFLGLVAAKERLASLPGIVESFAAAKIEMDGGIMGRVRSADPMEKADLESLTKSFAQKLGRKVSFAVTTDPELLAGIQVTVNGVTYDGSLRAQLDKLRNRVVTDARH